jgi:hypothetical protein
MNPPHFYIFCDYLPFEEDLALYLNKPEFPSLNEDVYQVLLNLACWFWRFFKNFQYCYSFAIISPWKGVTPFIWTNLNPLPPKDDLCKVWFKLAQWFWRSRFLNDPTPFLHFCDYLPLEEDLALYLNKLKFPSPKDNLYQVWLNLACWFWRRF